MRDQRTIVSCPKDNTIILGFHPKPRSLSLRSSDGLRKKGSQERVRLLAYYIICYNQSMTNFFNNTPLGKAIQSYLKTFLAVITGLFLATGGDIFAVTSDDLKLWLSAGIAAVLPLIITALNPADPRFGSNADKSLVKSDYTASPSDVDEELPEDDDDLSDELDEDELDEDELGLDNEEDDEEELDDGEFDEDEEDEEFEEDEEAKQ